MKKTSLLNFQFLTSSLVVLFLLFMPILIDAGTFYHCMDKGGNESLSDMPIDGQTCKQIGTYEKMTSSQEDHKTLKPLEAPGEKTTKIILKENGIFVPVTLVYGGNKVNVHLLLDTGASGTTIDSKIADQLSVNFSKSIQVKGKVVGGGVIGASVIILNRLIIGPHTIRDLNIFIVSSEGGSDTEYDGLLGMDVLRNLSYKVDFKKQLIIWE